MNATPYTRRDFLRQSLHGLGLVAFSPLAPAFLTRSLAAGAPLPEKDRRILVLVQLAGGNDGLNTLVPYADDHYYRLRPTLGVPQTELHRLNDHHGLHPNCGKLAALFQEGQLGIVQNVGYPNPNRSHFRSMEIWESASDSNETKHTGWLGRYFDHQCSGATQPSDDPRAIHLGQELPQSFLADQPHPIHGLTGINAPGNQRSRKLLGELAEAPLGNAEAHFLSHSLLNALVTEKRVEQLVQQNRPETQYPGGGFAASLKHIAALIAGGLETRVYFTKLGGFDTHANQQASHPRLMQQLSEGLAAFQADLRARKLSDQVLTMTFSEFGRRPAENGSGGTDHGTAAPLFIMGDAVRTPMTGQPPSLDLPEKADLTFSTDFRQVYATILQRWLDCDPAAVLGQPYDPLPVI